MDSSQNNETNGDMIQSNADKTNGEPLSNVCCSPTDHSISKLTNLSWELFRDIFDYLALGDIYYSFYDATKLLKEFIDNRLLCLNLIPMSYGQFTFYCEHILVNNTDHCQKICSLILTNEKPFKQIERFFPTVYKYTNLKKLYLYSPSINQLQILSFVLPNLSDLHIILKNEKLKNINWLSSLKKLQRCSIDSKTYGIEIDGSMRSLSSLLCSLSITLASTSDFYTLLSQLSVDALGYLNISLLDSEFSYIKTIRSPISLATKLIDFTFNMSLKAMKDASCLYDIIHFVSSSLRYVETLTILCRLANGVLIDENKLRDCLSYIYSVKTFKLFIEMNNLLTIDFNDIAYTSPFWIEKAVHVNVYRNKDNEIKRVRIYTLPLVSNIPNDSECTYRLIESELSNIHQFISNDLVGYVADDLTLTPNRTYSSSNPYLLFHLPRLSLFEVIENEMSSFLTILSQCKSFPNIRKLQVARFSDLLMNNSRQIFNIFPCLQSLSIDKVDEFNKFGDILDKFLIVLPNKSSFIHLRVSGLYFDDICPEYLNETELKRNLGEIFPALQRRKNPYDISFNRSHRSMDIWL